jgi:hypothetical protein
MFNSNDISELISAGCRDNQRICVFTQYIQGANKFNINKFLSSYSENVGKSKRLFRVDKSDKLYLLTTILHLVYTTLSSLSNFFTHYDLHMENVMLTEVPKGTYLRVNVHNGGNVISYRTKYLPIIIDYGRSFVDCSSVPSYKISNSENLAKRVCSTPDCNTPSQCGRDKGYAYIPERSVNNRFRPQTQDNSFIDITHVNRSFDIRLMSEIEIGFMFVGNSWIENNLNDILSIVRRGWPLHNQDARYGIEENPNFSVNDVFDILSEMIMDPKFESNNNNNFYEKNRYGTLDIWMDRSHPFKFVAN